MKIFKVDIPDDQMDFMLKLFDSLKIAYQDDSTQEERTYLAKDYMMKKGLIPMSKSGSSNPDKDQNIDKLKDLRQTINQIQDSRSTQTQVLAIGFRLPTASGAKTPKTQFKSYTELKTYLENYFRVGINHLTFTPTNGKLIQKDDLFEVNAHVKEANSKMTTINAGFSDRAFS